MLLRSRFFNYFLMKNLNWLNLRQKYLNWTQKYLHQIIKFSDPIPPKRHKQLLRNRRSIIQNPSIRWQNTPHTSKTHQSPINKNESTDNYRQSIKNPPEKNLKIIHSCPTNIAQLIMWQFVIRSSFIIKKHTQNERMNSHQWWTKKMSKYFQDFIYLFTQKNQK